MIIYFYYGLGFFIFLMFVLAINYIIYRQSFKSTIKKTIGKETQSEYLARKTHDQRFKK